MRGLLFSCMMMTAVTACGQTGFVLGLGAGMSSTSSGSGVLAFLEPAHRPEPNVAFGLRVQYMYSTNFSIGSITGNMQWYLMDTKLRPFIGLGAGLYRLASNEYGSPEVSSFGCYPRLGVEFERFMLTLDFNFVVKSPSYPSAAPASSIPGFEPPSNSNPNYLGTSVVYLFGRGVRRN